MKKLIVFVAVIFLLAITIYAILVRGVGVQTIISPSQTFMQKDGELTFTWQMKTEMPTERTEVAAALWDGKIYVVGGMDGFAGVSKAVEVYDPSSDNWANGPDLPEGRHHAAVTSLNNALYVIGGYSDFAGTPVDTVYKLTQGTDKWMEVAPLPNPRGALAAGVTDGKIYAVGGVGKIGLTSELSQYDPDNDKWTVRKSAPTKRDHLAVSGGEKLLYVGGGRELDLDKNLNILEIYDPATDTWTQGSDMPTARGGVAGTFFNGMFVVVGGEQPSGTFDSVEAFDPVSDSWITLPNLPTPRHGLAAVTVENVLYVIGGGKRPGLSVSGNNEALLVR